MTMKQKKKVRRYEYGMKYSRHEKIAPNGVTIAGPTSYTSRPDPRGPTVPKGSLSPEAVDELPN